MQMVGIPSSRVSASVFPFICNTLTAFTLLWLSIYRFMFSSQAQKPCQDFRPRLCSTCQHDAGKVLNKSKLR